MRKQARLQSGSYPWSGPHSYGFSGYNVTVVSFWFFYVANQVALPLYLAAFFLPSRRMAIPLATIASIHAFLSGFPSSYLFTGLFVTLFVLLWFVLKKEFEPTFRWISSQALAGVCLSPVLFFAVSGFLSSTRSGYSSLANDTSLIVPFFTIPFGWFLAGLGASVGPAFSYINSTAGVSYIFFTAAVSWWLLACCHRSNQAARQLETVLLLCGIFAVLLLVRPFFVSSLFDYLPFFRNARWPFRETFLLIFVLHFWIALRLHLVSIAWTKRLIIPGWVFLVISISEFKPATFRLDELDRRLLLSGEAERHWEKIKNNLPKGSQVIPLLDPESIIVRPMTLVGACNYPSFFGVTSVTGYSSTAPRDSLPLRKIYPYTMTYVSPADLSLFTENLSCPLFVSGLWSLDPPRAFFQEASLGAEAKAPPEP